MGTYCRRNGERQGLRATDRRLETRDDNPGADHAIACPVRRKPSTNPRLLSPITLVGPQLKVTLTS